MDNFHSDMLICPKFKVGFVLRVCKSSSLSIFKASLYVIFGKIFWRQSCLHSFASNSQGSIPDLTWLLQDNSDYLPPEEGVSRRHRKTCRQTYIQTLQLYDWIGRVGRFSAMMCDWLSDRIIVAWDDWRI